MPATGRGFEPLAELESDRSGVLMSARSEVSEALVDIRVLSPALLADRGFVRHLGKDMSVLREVRHTNLVSVMDFDKRVGAVIYESVPGSSLEQVLTGQGSLGLAASLVLLDDCAAGLEALHNVGILHGNVTPQAVVIETTGAVLLRDAGLAARGGAAELPPVERTYVAPEVVGGAEYTAAADLYAATAVFVEAIGGRASKTGVRTDLRSLITAGMAADPSERSNISDFRNRLDAYARGTIGEAWRKEGRALLTAAATAHATRALRVAPTTAPPDEVDDAKASVALLQSERRSNTRWLVVLGAVTCVAVVGATFAARMTARQGQALGGALPASVPAFGIPGFYGQAATPTPGNPGTFVPPTAVPGLGFVIPPVLGPTSSANPTPAPTPTPNPALGSQTIAFTTTTPSGAVYGGSYVVSATGGASGNPIVFNTGSPNTGCTKVGANTFRFTGVGTCTITAHQAGNSRYNPTQNSQSFGIGQASQAIVYGPYPSSPTYLGSFTVTASAPGGLVNFLLDPQSTACTLSSGAVQFTGVGACIIDANQAGDAYYTAATMRQLLLTVGQASQSIATPFNYSPAIVCSPTCVGSSYAVSATGGGSGNPVTFTLVSGSCSIAGNTITIVGPGPGSCTIQANQAGNTNYSGAPPVQQTINYT